uniref:Calmodulin n=1 Tax=Alexandrium catenella TaxID=2925 RepID=A0A7S1LFX5_ALECA|mmetsp:Transcript_11273/g.30696  ORF Transcript_11273/g.30696 Transcript_11273/m.30696 type:complete len:166 (+) Transcript_11273:49-546(+)|eukprot:CAMPEP_0171199244 /NCGR_PEP_ID=MMETSP0790-20130122/23364_1 /TAXON_ID=2925 /ORGANISM="Alexandrium catenella, Strain OF101" /LENGTH=165 /DNA_ID=CAMNT_0011664585 /DNA_START=47 /DNA_END=544 /DNA_ORIENTATION=-
MAGKALEILLTEGGALNKEQKEKIEDNFKLLDRDADGKLTVQEVGVLFRALGQSPTDEELAELLRQVPPGGADVEGFNTFFTKNYKTPPSPDALLKAFQVFDLGETGIMNADKFKEMLTSLGEPMPDEEVQAILKEANIDDKGIFDYKALVKTLCEGPKKLPDLK